MTPSIEQWPEPHGRMCSLYRGWKLLPSCRGIIWSHKDIIRIPIMNQPGFRGMSCPGFVAVAQFVFQAEMMQPQGLCWCWQQLHWKLWTLLQLGMTFEAGERETNHNRNQRQSSLHEGSSSSSLFFWGECHPDILLVFFLLGGGGVECDSVES